MPGDKTWWKEQATETDTAETQTAELADEHFKITILSVLKEPKDMINKFMEGETWKQKRVNENSKTEK